MASAARAVPVRRLALALHRPDGCPRLDRDQATATSVGSRAGAVPLHGFQPQHPSVCPLQCCWRDGSPCGGWRCTPRVPLSGPVPGSVAAKMRDGQPHAPLHGVTLEMIVTALADHYGWAGFAERVSVRCFSSQPSVSSGLKFLRKTPWAPERWKAFTCSCCASAGVRSGVESGLDLFGHRCLIPHPT